MKVVDKEKTELTIDICKFDLSSEVVAYLRLISGVLKKNKLISGYTLSFFYFWELKDKYDGKRD